MTVIAAMARAGQVHMAADTGSQVDGTVYHNDQKLFTLPIQDSDEVVAMGFAGNMAIKFLVRQHLKIDDVPPPGDDLIGWASAIAEAICGIVVDARPAPVDEAGWIAGLALMGFRGQVWLMTHQNAAPLTLPYSAIGSGADLAMGVLHAQRDTEDPTAALDLAVRTACLFDSGCTILEAGPRHLVV